VVVDEAWSLMREHEGARFLARMAKSARKRRAGLAVITQDAADLLGSDLGQVVVANAATQILMRQAPQAIDAVAATFALTAGEAQLLLSAGRGQALLLGAARTSFTTVSSAEEHELAAGWADLTGHPDDDNTGHAASRWER
jgi:DNA helicase HerA-like ATPase